MNREILGIDLGGTNLRGGIVNGNRLSSIISEKISSNVSKEEMLQGFFYFVDRLVTPSTEAIGIGVPGLVVDGIVYDVVNIPSWKEISLQKLVQERMVYKLLLTTMQTAFLLENFILEWDDSMTR